MAEQAKVLVVAHQTASTEGLLQAVRDRSQQGPTAFHLLVPRQPHGMHKVVDPHEAGEDEAREVIEQAQPRLSQAAGAEVTSSIGDPDPLAAIEDAVNLGNYDEIIISTLPRRISKWLKLDLVSKTRGLGLPVTHVEATQTVSTTDA
jgi:hypothetical protein